MRSAVLSAYGDDFGLVSIGELEPNTDIAILDSCFKPVQSFRDSYPVGHTEDFIGRPGIDDTTHHGQLVADILSAFTDNGRYNFYRIVQESGTIRQREVLKALGRAHLDHEVDVIHMSIGFDHSHDGVSCDMPSEPCKVRDAAVQATADGIVVVAAAGNSVSPANDDSICCPALATDVISVGGVYPACGAAFSSMSKRPGMNPKKLSRPPLAAWVADGDGNLKGHPICTGLDCGPGHSCKEDKIMKSWSGNVDSDSAMIDILAPVLFPLMKSKNEPGITSGTSFAAPCITAVVAEIITLMKSKGCDYSPSQIQNAIMNTSNSADIGDGSYVQGRDAINQISSRKNLGIKLVSSNNDTNSFERDF